jgi:hypothetical protein
LYFYSLIQPNRPRENIYIEVSTAFSLFTADRCSDIFICDATCIGFDHLLAIHYLRMHLLVIPLHVQVTLALQPQFKRSVTFVPRDESDMAEQVALWGALHEFADISWLPRLLVATSRPDHRHGS